MFSLQGEEDERIWDTAKDDDNLDRVVDDAEQQRNALTTFYDYLGHKFTFLYAKCECVLDH